VKTGRRIKWYKSGDLLISEQTTALAIWGCGLTVLSFAVDSANERMCPAAIL